MAPQFVKLYVNANKHDRADAEAICEAVAQPNIRFVVVKTVEQQAVLSMHRARQGLVKMRTAQANQIRGLLAEFGLIVPQGIHQLRRQLPARLEVSEAELGVPTRQLLARLGEHLIALDREVKAIEHDIRLWHRACAASRVLAEQPGIGPLTASAFVATLGQAIHFKSGRPAASCLGLVPRQHSTGGKAKLLGISKRGDPYLRTLLIHGARLVMQAASRQPEKHPWLISLVARCGKNVARWPWPISTRQAWPGP